MLALAALHVLRRGATTVPGRVALAVDPLLPRAMAGRLREGVTLVTGTNGKTTTSAMLAAVLAEHGWRLAHNRGGANLRSGIATALLAARRADAALLEVDEGTMPFAGGMGPRLAVVTNFFRDQLDRYGELNSAVARVRSGLQAMPPGALAVLNADDPLVAALGDASHLRVLYFGIDAKAAGEAAGEGDAARSDAPPCPACGATLVYAPRHYAHLGRYRCPDCGYARPAPAARVVDWRPAGPRQPGTLRLATPAGGLDLDLHLPGLYNAYNAAAAATAALALGVPVATVAAALGHFRHAFGRMEWLTLEGHPCCLVLVKNPAGCSLALRAALDDPATGGALVLALNDRTADGTDVSWIWDADFEVLAADQQRFNRVVASGVRAADMALRLKYAGIAAERLAVVPDPLAAARAAAQAAAPGAPIYALPTYTAMLDLRGALARLGLLPPFWEV